MLDQDSQYLVQLLGMAACQAAAQDTDLMRRLLLSSTASLGALPVVAIGFRDVHRGVRH